MRSLPITGPNRRRLMGEYTPFSSEAQEGISGGFVGPLAPYAALSWTNPDSGIVSVVAFVGIDRIIA